MLPLVQESNLEVFDSLNLKHLKNETEILDFFKGTIKKLPRLILFNVASVTNLSNGTMDLTFQYLKIKRIDYLFFRWSNQPEQSLVFENYRQSSIIEIPSNIDAFGRIIKDMIKEK